MDDVINSLGFELPFMEQPDFEEWSAMLITTIKAIAGFDIGWFWEFIEQFPGEFIQLAEWIDDIGGIFPPPGWTWPQWIESTFVASDILRSQFDGAAVARSAEVTAMPVSTVRQAPRAPSPPAPGGLWERGMT